MRDQPLRRNRNGVSISFRGNVKYKSQWAMDPVGAWVARNAGSLVASAMLDIQAGDTIQVLNLDGTVNETWYVGGVNLKYPKTIAVLERANHG